MRWAPLGSRRRRRRCNRAIETRPLGDKAHATRLAPEVSAAPWKRSELACRMCLSSGCGRSIFGGRSLQFVARASVCIVLRNNKRAHGKRQPPPGALVQWMRRAQLRHNYITITHLFACLFCAADRLSDRRRRTQVIALKCLSSQTSPTSPWPSPSWVWRRPRPTRVQLCAGRANARPIRVIII